MPPASRGLGSGLPLTRKKISFMLGLKKKKHSFFPFEKYNILVSFNFIRKIQAFGYP
jgi:hypothetical protein